MRRAARVDANQKEIVDALRDIGASVQSIAPMGRGVPDILVGFRGGNWIFEIKDGSKPPSERKLTEDEREWHRRWRGQVTTVHNIDEVMAAIGASYVGAVKRKG